LENTKGRRPVGVAIGILARCIRGGNDEGVIVMPTHHGAIWIWMSWWWCSLLEERFCALWHELRIFVKWGLVGDCGKLWDLWRDFLHWENWEVPGAALWAILNWAKSEKTQSGSVGYFFIAHLWAVQPGWAIFMGNIQIRPNGLFVD
jgi:hypothetical protein